MHVEWYGQSSFALRADGPTVFIDPFADLSAAAAPGVQFDYPPITGVEAELLLVTHGANTIFAFDFGGLRVGHSATSAKIARQLGARWVVPVHDRTHRIGFLETVRVP